MRNFNTRERGSHQKEILPSIPQLHYGPLQINFIKASVRKLYIKTDLLQAFPDLHHALDQHSPS